MLDEPGTRGRAKRDVPAQNVDNLRDFIARGLTRFAVEPIDLTVLAGNVPAALFAALPDHRPISFGRGGLQVEIADGEHAWLVALGPGATAGLLAEMIAALVYHYDPDDAGGTAITDVCINDGDFVVKRRRDGTFDVRLTAARHRERGISPSLLLLYLIQMMAYEDWSIDGKLVGLPTLACNPSVAFAGVVRGLSTRSRDRGQNEIEGDERARRWIRDFGRSREGRAYRPWAERFLDGRLPPSFGDDPRERWWRLVHLKTKLGVLELRARQDPAADEASSVRALRSFIDRLSRAIGRRPDDDGGAARLNDMGRDDLLRLLEDARVPPESRDAVAGELFARWPYRGVDHLVAPSRPRRHAPDEEPARVRAVVATPTKEPSPASAPTPTASASRPLANPETYGGPMPPSLPRPRFGPFRRSKRTWTPPSTTRAGATTRAVSRSGAAATSSRTPNHCRPTTAAGSPRARSASGRTCARTASCRTPTRSRSSSSAQATAASRATCWTRSRTARRPTSAAGKPSRPASPTASTRRPRRCAIGSARCWAPTPRRRRGRAPAGGDAGPGFPGGLTGLVVTNEVPDAFGVHKVVMSPDAVARVALVVPRVEAALRDAVAPRSRAGSPRRTRSRAGPSAARQRRGLLPGRRDLDGGDGGAGRPSS